MKKREDVCKLALVACAILMSQAGHATEGGGGMYPNGIENYLVAAVPPPGFYLLGYTSRYEANTLRGNNGSQVPIDFHLTVNAVAPRFIWVTNKTILGGQLAFDFIPPLLDVELKAGGSSQRKQGLGDSVLGMALGYHLSDKLHTVVIQDTFMPTGDYDKNAALNLGRNYWTAETVVAATYVQPTGFNGDIKVMLDINSTNNATNYRSGHELHADYAAGWGFGNGWVAGVGGYAYKQITDDKQNGIEIGNRGQAFAFGPSIKYDNGKGWFVIAKLQKEFSVVNRPQGSELKIKTIIPF